MKHKTKCVIAKLLFVLVIFSSPFVSHATDYFVASPLHGGSDDNDGTTAPWATLEHVRDMTSSYVAGDRILFNRGDVFYGFLQFTSPEVGWFGTAHSGTETLPITIGAYGSGDLPIIQYDPNIPIDPYDPDHPDANNRFKRNIMFFGGVKYWIIENINFTDVVYTQVDHYNPSHNSCAIQFGYSGQDDLPTRCNHMMIRNCEISLCGLGVVINGDSNTVTHCTMSKFNNLKSTLGTYLDPPNQINEDVEDYGANGVTICGEWNEVSYNDIRDAWAESLDFAWNGGATEMIDVCKFNRIIYNTFYDCGGIAEFGGLDRDLTTGYNLFAYNKIVNCGGLTYCNIDQNFAITVEDNQWFNNVVVENDDSRFSGIHAGRDLQDPVAISHLVPDYAMFQYGSAPITGTLNIVKNNIFQISSGMPNVFKEDDPHLEHSYNIFKLFTPTQVNTALSQGELSTQVYLFTDTTDANPINWDFHPLPGSPQIASGTDVGFVTDFDGHAVGTPPTIGPLEYLGTILEITTGTIMPSATCAGTSISIPFTVNQAANAGNVFSAYLVEAYSAYPTPILLGSITSTTGGTITGTVPTSPFNGYYQVYVTASSPAQAHITYSDLTVYGVETASAGSYSNVTLITPPFQLAGYPQSGTFSGTGVSNNVFNPVVAGQGTFTITYTYIGKYGCVSTATTTITVGCGYKQDIITGPDNACLYKPNLDAVYHLNVIGASSVTWSIVSSPTNTATIFSSSYSQGVSTGIVHYPLNFSSGTLKATIVNACDGSITVLTMAITSTLPAYPNPITGPSNVCGYIGTTNTATYSIDPLLNTSSYVWSVPTGMTILPSQGPNNGQGTTSITVGFTTAVPTSGAFLSVKGVSPCGNGPGRALSIIRSAPQTPAAIQGPTDACYYIANNTSATYSVPNSNTVTYYTWAVTAGTATIVGGQGSSSVQLSFPPISQNFYNVTLTVTGTNYCGTSPARSITIYQTPSTPVLKSGTETPCPGATEYYTVFPLPGNILYVWTAFPTPSSSMTITEGNGSPMIKAVFSSSFTSATLTVSAHTVCGNGGTRYIYLVKCNSGKIQVVDEKTKETEVLTTSTIFPNPSSGDFTISLDTKKTNTVAVEILDETGRTVYQHSQKCDNGLVTMRLAGKLPDGIYWVNCMLNHERIIKKLVIVK